MSTRIYLQKNDTSKNEKLPYFTLVIPPKEEDGEWVKIGALWKAKSGNGYSGTLNDNVQIKVTPKAVEPKKEEDDFGPFND